MAGSEPAKISEFVELLAVVADPERMQDAVDKLRSASEDAKVKADLLIPAAEIKKLRDEAVASAKSASVARDKAISDISQSVLAAQSTAQEILSTASKAAEKLVSEATRLLEAAKLHEKDAQAMRDAVVGKLTAIVEEYITKSAEAEIALSSAVDRERSAEKMQAMADAARADLARRLETIRVAAGV